MIAHLSQPATVLVYLARIEQHHVEPQALADGASVLVEQTDNVSGLLQIFMRYRAKRTK